MRDYEAEMRQLMLDRMQMLEEACERAEAGVATEDDWVTIRRECGLPRRPFVTMESVSITRSEE